VQHLFNVKRLAYETAPPPAAALVPGSTDDPAQLRTGGALPAHGYGAVANTVIANPGADKIDEIVRRVLAELKAAGS
jgi:hypothetical protein